MSDPRAAILDAAVRLFGQQSYVATSMRDIAPEVGILPGSLYAHIASKEELLFSIVDAGIESFMSVVEPFSTGGESPALRLRGAIKAHVAVVADNPERSLVVFHQWRFLPDKQLADAIAKWRRYERAFRAIVEQGISDGLFRRDLNARIAVLSTLGALNRVPEWYSPAGRSSQADRRIYDRRIAAGIAGLTGTRPYPS